MRPPSKRAKVAVTDRAAAMVTSQVVLVVVQAPVKPTKPKPGAGVAVRVTTRLGAKSPTQSLPQSTPAGMLETEPEPTFVTVSLKLLKVAVTAFAAFMVTIQVALVLTQAPVQPVKADWSGEVG